MELATASGTLDPRIEIFYWQYQQQLTFNLLQFPPNSVLLETAVQWQIHKWMFTRHLMFPETFRARPSLSYKKKVLKKIVEGIEAAVTDPGEHVCRSPILTLCS